MLFAAIHATEGALVFAPDSLKPSNPSPSTNPLLLLELGQATGQATCSPQTLTDWTEIAATLASFSEAVEAEKTETLHAVVSKPETGSKKSSGFLRTKQQGEAENSAGHHESVKDGVGQETWLASLFATTALARPPVESSPEPLRWSVEIRPKHESSAPNQTVEQDGAEVSPGAPLLTISNSPSSNPPQGEPPVTPLETVFALKPSSAGERPLTGEVAAPLPSAGTGIEIAEIVAPDVEVSMHVRDHAPPRPTARDTGSILQTEKVLRKSSVGEASPQVVAPDLQSDDVARVSTGSKKYGEHDHGQSNQARQHGHEKLAKTVENITGKSTPLEDMPSAFPESAAPESHSSRQNGVPPVMHEVHTGGLADSTTSKITNEVRGADTLDLTQLPNEPEILPKPVSNPAREIKLNLSELTGDDVKLTLRDSSSDIQIRLQAGDSELRHLVQSEISDLADRLDRAGFEVDSWVVDGVRGADLTKFDAQDHDGASTSERRHDPRESSPDTSRHDQQGRGARQDRSLKQWMELMENTKWQTR